MADLTIVTTNFQKGISPVFPDDALFQYGPMICGEDIFDGAAVYFVAGADGTRLMLASAAVNDAASYARGVVMRGNKQNGTATPYFLCRVGGIAGGADGGTIYLSDTPGRLADAAGTTTRRVGHFYEIHGQTDLIAALFFPPNLSL